MTHKELVAEMLSKTAETQSVWDRTLQEILDLRQQVAAAHEAIEVKNAAIRLALEEGDLYASDDAKLEAALAIQPDLDGLILCHAEPIGDVTDFWGELSVIMYPRMPPAGTKLYRAWEQGK